MPKKRVKKKAMSQFAELAVYKLSNKQCFSRRKLIIEILNPVGLLK